VLALLSSQGFISSGGYLAIFVLSVAQSCCVPTSSELTLGFGGVLAATGRLSLPGVIAAGVTGEVIGAYLAWWIGRSAGRTIVDRYGRYVLLSHHDLDRAEAWYDRHGRWGVLGGRLVPVIRNFAALPAGVAEVPPVPFGLMTVTGSLIWDSAMALIGYSVGSRWSEIIHGFSDAGYVLGALAVLAFALFFVHRWRTYRRQTEASRGRSADGPPVPGEELVALIRRLAAPGEEAPERTGASMNERLTAATAAVLFVLLAAEGATILKIRSLLTPHVVIGLILIPPVVVKIGSTTWRFGRYYLGEPGYVAKGPPQALLRVLAPLLVVLTVSLFASGIALVVVHRPPAWVYDLHRYGFVPWFAIMVVHVLAYVWRVPGLIRPDLASPGRRQRARVPAPAPGRWARLWLLGASLLAGVALTVRLWPTFAGNVHAFVFH
jgi:membrane protein DedA with SNARE-associated domain